MHKKCSNIFRYIKGLGYAGEKIFCVGRNKTGTTSVKSALRNLGFKVAPQAPAERMLQDWAQRDFSRLKRFCLGYDAYQDVPFSYPYTCMALDQAFPNAKFILTVRDSADEWYQSLTRAHAKKFSAGMQATAEELKQATYRYRGFLWDCQRLLYGVSEQQVYDYDIYTKHYEWHNTTICEYFRWRPEKLLVINVKEAGAYNQFAQFLCKDAGSHKDFPWENRTGSVSHSILPR